MRSRCAGLMTNGIYVPIRWSSPGTVLIRFLGGIVFGQIVEGSHSSGFVQGKSCCNRSVPSCRRRE